MTVIIKKGDTQKDVESAIKKLNKKRRKPRLADFYGKLKGQLGDGLTYQKQVRNEWD